jgi:hypothetical protein
LTIVEKVLTNAGAVGVQRVSDSVCCRRSTVWAIRAVDIGEESEDRLDHSARFRHGRQVAEVVQFGIAAVRDRGGDLPGPGHEGVGVFSHGDC